MLNAPLFGSTYSGRGQADLDAPQAAAQLLQPFDHVGLVERLERYVRVDLMAQVERQSAKSRGVVVQILGRDVVWPDHAVRDIGRIRVRRHRQGRQRLPRFPLRRPVVLVAQGEQLQPGGLRLRARRQDLDGRSHLVVLQDRELGIAIDLVAQFRQGAVVLKR